MSLRVHFNRISFSDYTDEFKSLLDKEIKISEGNKIPDPANFDILVYPTPSKEWIEASPNLKAVVVPWAGIPEKTREVMKAYPDISVHNLHHNNYNTAELGFGLLLAAAKCIIPFDRALRNNDWTPRYQQTQAILLRQKKALILGFGEIGQALAAYCLGLGMKVMATKKHPNEYEGDLDVDIYPDNLLHELLPTTDVLLIALPLTDETENLIGETELSLMPEGSILVNVGRGTIVDQYALYDALKERRIRAAASDVWYNYPESKEDRKDTPPADVPFGELDNFVLSPHRGGLVEEVEQQRAQALARLLNAANRGNPIPNKVNLDAGY
ncbi:MAG: 2-hydroxyacid dehydrogenase [Chloroflexota bacterium]|jgi:phosphoglycerate dehydrogenase-like enzyme|nr:2-hydroxyacid dehydrogenase [Chloroflexota bacterium]